VDPNKEVAVRSLILASGMLLVAGGATAQEWSAEQRGLIDHVRTCWDAWVEALADETPVVWEQACPTDERAHWWWTADGAPNLNLEEVRRNWHVIREVDDDWASFRPIFVDIFDDVGIVYLYGHWRANTADGTVVTEMKRTEVFQRRGSDWVFIGAQGSPVTPGDAAPYRR
jgi:hypothetical protein